MSQQGRVAAGQRIADELEDREWTQGDLAARAKIGVDAVSDIINAKTVRPRPRTIRGIEDSFGWERGTIRSMFDGGEPPPMRRQAVTDEDLIDLSGLSEESKAALKAHLRFLEAEDAQKLQDRRESS